MGCTIDYWWRTFDKSSIKSSNVELNGYNAFLGI